MRNLNRIKPFCEDFALLWKQTYPDLRFGQLITNFAAWVDRIKKVDIYYLEESTMIEYFREYCEKKGEFR